MQTGSIRGVDVASGDEVAVIPSTTFKATFIGAGRIIIYDITTTISRNNGITSFASNYLHIPFLTLDADTLTVTLRFDAEQNLFVYEYHEATSTTIDEPATFSFVTGLLNIPNISYRGNTYHATLKQVPGTLNFNLEGVGTH